MNREAWLIKAADQLRKQFPSEYNIPPFQVSVGLPSGGCRNSTMGETWSKDVTKGTNTIFISPKYADPIKVLQTLLHEMIHVENDCKDGHNARFARIAREVGLIGPPTATYPSKALRVKLQEIATKLGPYQHQPMSFDKEKKQKTYLIRLMCECGYLVRVTQMHINTGLPYCPNGHILEVK